MADQKKPDQSLFLDYFSHLKAAPGYVQAALQSDWEDVKEGRMPQNTGKFFSDVIGAYSNPAVGGMIPTIPTYTNPSMEVIKSIANKQFKAGKPIGDVLQYVHEAYAGMSPEATAMAKPTGQFVQASQMLGKK